MDFDDLEAAEEPLDQDLLELLERYEAPDSFKDFLRDEGLHSCLLLAKYCDSKEDAEAKILSKLPAQQGYKLKVVVRNVWNACKKGKGDQIESVQAERAKQGGIVLKLFDSDDTFKIPADADVKAGNIKETLRSYLGSLPSDFCFFTRDEGGVDKRLADTAIMPNSVYCLGIDSFTRQRHHYAHPFVVIGAGHMGLRHALMCSQEKVHDYVVFEKHGAVGGTAWLVNANFFSKVQSELGTYHLDYSEHNECPKNMSPWPSRDELLRHFEHCCDLYGMTPHIRLNTEVLKFKIHTQKDSKEQSYEMQLEVKKEDGTFVNDSMMGSSVNYYPGNLTIPRRDKYKGEDNFEGVVCYGMFGETNYELCRGAHVAVVGMGAFAIENVRTSVEHRAKQIYILCRRKHLAMPRMTSWFVNNSFFPIAGPTFINHMKPMYDLFGEDPWDYHSVTSNTARTMATVNQSARTGIGDIYFLARYYGKVNVIQSSVLRLTRKDIILDIGTDLTMESRTLSCSVIIKSLGFEPDLGGDKLMQCTELTGYWINGDHRRSAVSDLRSLYASNFGGTSLSPGAIVWCAALLHVLHFPKDFEAFMATGACPVHKAEPDKNYPAIVISAKDGSTLMMIVSNSLPWAADDLNAKQAIKRAKNQGCHSLEQVQKLCEEEWFRYCEVFKEQGDNRPFPPYPYSLQDMQKAVEDQDRDAAAKFGIPWPPE